MQISTCTVPPHRWNSAACSSSQASLQVGHDPTLYP